MANKEKKIEIPTIHTGIFTLGKAYSILCDVGVEWLIAGKPDDSINFDMLRKQAMGESKFDDKAVEEELKKVSHYIQNIVDKLLGNDRKLIEFYEIITKTHVTEDDDPDIEIALECIANFFFGIVGKVPKFLAKIMLVKQMRTSS